MDLDEVEIRVDSEHSLLRLASIGCEIRAQIAQRQLMRGAFAEAGVSIEKYLRKNCETTLNALHDYALVYAQITGECALAQEAGRAVEEIGEKTIEDLFEIVEDIAEKLSESARAAYVRMVEEDYEAVKEVRK